MRSFTKEVAIWRLYLLQSVVVSALAVSPAFAAKGATASRPLWLTIYKMIPPDLWIFVAVIGIVGIVWLLFFSRVKDCKCKCGIICKCNCNCSASCGCQVPVLKLKR